MTKIVRATKFVKMKDYLLLNRNNFIGEGKARVPIKEYAETGSTGEYAIVEAQLITEACYEILVNLSFGIHYTINNGKVFVKSEKKELEGLYKATLEYINVFYPTKEHWEQYVKAKRNPLFVPKSEDDN